MTADPFDRIPNAGDDEYAGTELETPQQRERRTARDIGAQRASELLAASDDPNWLGI